MIWLLLNDYLFTNLTYYIQIRVNYLQSTTIHILHQISNLNQYLSLFLFEKAMLKIGVMYV